MTPDDIRREAKELELFLNAPPKAVAALRALADVVEAMQRFPRHTYPAPVCEALARVEALHP